MADALCVTAHLSSPLAGDAPHLDALLVYVSSRLQGKDADPDFKVDRKYPCPPTDHIPIGIPRNRVGSQRWNVARCTSPILDVVKSDGVEHVAKRIAVEHATLLDPGERKVVTTSNGWTKSYRLPLRVRRVARIAWLCVGDRRAIKQYLRLVPAVGKKISDGYGRVSRWDIERIGDVSHDRWPWWIDSDAGPVLMRPLPADGEMPAGLLGWRLDYGACVDPYWHQDRYCEIITSC